MILPRRHLPVEPVVCVARVRIGVVAAEVITCFGILKNTRCLIRSRKPAAQLSETAVSTRFYVYNHHQSAVLMLCTGPAHAKL